MLFKRFSIAVTKDSYEDEMPNIQDRKYKEVFFCYFINHG